jgi:hypothetical protein
MLQIIEIKKGSQHLPQVQALYESAFPANERIPMIFLIALNSIHHSYPSMRKSSWIAKLAKKPMKPPVYNKKKYIIVDITKNRISRLCKFIEKAPSLEGAFFTN